MKALARTTEAMTVFSEAKRTLVKSPPELWSELSDAESLARHLDGVQQIRITRATPESTIEWEAEGAKGSVHLEPSGFGTKVTLALCREATEPAVATPPAEPVEAELESTESEPVATVNAEPAPEAVIEPEPIPSEAEPFSRAPEPEPQPVSVAEPKLSFFARLFRRQRKQQSSVPVEEPVVPTLEPEPEPEPAVTASWPVATEPQPAATEPEIAAEPEAESEPQPPAGIAEDLVLLEAEIVEQDTQTLTAMLDRLGAAHHRPFSRS